MGVEIREVVSSAQRRIFAELPLKLYKGNTCWVPPIIQEDVKLLEPAHNPSLEVCDMKAWLAYKDGKPAGRIVGIINRPFMERWGKKDGRFGWIEFSNDEEVFAALMDTVENWCRSRGMDALVGPMGFTDMDPQGMLVEGFDELGTFAMIYNHEYYPRHLETRGYVKDVDWVEYSVRTPSEGVPEKVRRVQELVFKRNKLTLLNARRRQDFLPYVSGLFDVLQDAYKDLYGYVPLTPAQVQKYTDEYFSFVDPRFTKVVLDDQQKVAAVGIALPSLSRAMQKARGRIFPFGIFHIMRAMKKPEILDLYLVAVRPDLQNLGVNAILMNEITQNAIDAGIAYAETNAELEDNQAVRSFWKHYDARQHKRRRVYRKVL